MERAEKVLDLILCPSPPGEDPRPDAIRTIADALVDVERDALERGFLGGFAASGEGWNAEYPFADIDQNPLDDPDWRSLRDEFVARVSKAGGA